MDSYSFRRHLLDGVLESDIVLAFYHCEHRQYTDFAVG
ncbi:element excision factor XisI family protein [Baaleninema sp.]